MKSARPAGDPVPEPPDLSAKEDVKTGLPGLRSWRAVYFFVLATFLLWLLLLAGLMGRFS